MRPAEVDVLRGNATKAYKQLNWAPKTDFKQMVHTMVQNDIKLLSK
jgi:GDPmannose 4,6-dehydratase